MHSRTLCTGYGLQVSENFVQCISGLLLATLHPVLLRCIAYQSSDLLLFFVHSRTDEQCSELTQTGVIHDSLQQLSVKLIKKNKSAVFEELSCSAVHSWMNFPLFDLGRSTLPHIS